MTGRSRLSLVLVVVAATGQALFLSWMWHRRVLSHALLWPLDVANINQAIWNTAHGKPYFCTVLYEATRDHFDVVWMAFAPVYWLTNEISWVFLPYSVVLASGAVAVFLISRAFLPGTALPILLAVLYLSFPPLLELRTFHFRGDCLAVPFLLFAALFFLEERFRPFVVCLVLALACKESVSMLVAVWGMVAIFQRAQKRWWATMIGLSLTVLAFTFFLYIPYLHGLPYKATLLGRAPSHLGYGAVLAAESWWHLVRMFFPGFTLVAVLSSVTLLPAVPLLAASFVWRDFFHHPMWVYWIAPAYGFLFPAVVVGTRRLLDLASGFRHGRQLVTGALVISIAGSLPAVVRLGLMPPIGDEDRRIRRLVQSIPVDASVSALPLILPVLSTRSRLHTLAFKPHERNRSIDPLDVDFVLLSTDGPILSELVEPPRAEGLTDAYFRAVERARSDPELELVRQSGSWELYRRRPAQHATDEEDGPWSPGASRALP